MVVAVAGAELVVVATTDDDAVVVVGLGVVDWAEIRPTSTVTSTRRARAGSPRGRQSCIRGSGQGLTQQIGFRCAGVQSNVGIVRYCQARGGTRGMRKSEGMRREREGMSCAKREEGEGKEERKSDAKKEQVSANQRHATSALIPSSKEFPLLKQLGGPHLLYRVQWQAN